MSQFADVLQKSLQDYKRKAGGFEEGIIIITLTHITLIKN